MKQTELQEFFSSFREQCIWLRCCYNTYLALYESGDCIKEVLQASAPEFFHELNTILIEYVLLQICKITDPAESRGHKNLTFEGVNTALEENGLMSKEIADFSSGVSRYRDLVKDSRNKLISHLDSRNRRGAVPAHIHRIVVGHAQTLVPKRLLHNGSPREALVECSSTGSRAAIWAKSPCGRWSQSGPPPPA